MSDQSNNEQVSTENMIKLCRNLNSTWPSYKINSNDLADRLQSLTDELVKSTAERDIWKSQLEYIKDKHLELHQDEKNHIEEWEVSGKEYDGQKFDNSVICVWEVAVSMVKKLNDKK